MMYSFSSPSGAYISDNYNHHKEEKSAKRLRKIPAAKDHKIMKKPIAPWPRTPPKVYKVAPVDFRDVVQKLTGAPEFQPTRLHEAAAPLPHEWFPLAHHDHMRNAPPFAEGEQRRSVEMISFGDPTSPRALSVSPPSLCMDFTYSF